MPLYRASLQTLGAIVLLALAFACKSSSNATPTATTTATITGTVTYARVPLVKDTSGLPIGLADATVATNLQTLPARGITVRFFQQVEQTQPDGSKTMVWVFAGASSTDSTGLYSFTASKDRLTMVEVLSTFNGGINLIGEPGGITSTARDAAHRWRYALRKAADGTAPANDKTPNSMLTANTTLNFSVGLNDEWWLVDPSYTQSNNQAPLITQAVLETSVSGRTPGQGSGSRILGIGDSIAAFVAVYGAAAPGGILDLHYWPGLREAKGSFVEYNRSLAIYPKALDGSNGAIHFFGSLGGSPANDDAWDEGVILPLLARNVLFAGNANRTFAVPLNFLFPPGTALNDLSPDLARLEGLADAMAANVLKSPYLADTQAASLAVSDLRTLTGAQLTPYSAPAIRALAWQIILKANSLPSPGVSADWSSIAPAAAARFFVTQAGVTNGATDATARDIEPLNIYTQLNRLKEAKGTTDTVDLAAIFTEATLTSLTTPFGITWPRPTAGSTALFVADWGTDPNSLTTALPPMTLSMAKAVQVNGTYPNVSQGEVFYAGFNLTADKHYVISATITPALAAGSQVEVDLPRLGRLPFTFTLSGGSQPAVTFPVNATAPYYHPVRVRLRSATAVQPDVTVTLAFTPAP